MAMTQYWNGTLSPKIEPKYKHKFNVVDGKVIEVKEIVVHIFRMSDCEDPDIYVAEPLYNWQQTEQGKWIMEHAVETPCWLRYNRYETYELVYCITAKLTTKDLTYFYLKWGNPVDTFNRR